MEYKEWAERDGEARIDLSVEMVARDGEATLDLCVEMVAQEGQEKAVQGRGEEEKAPTSAALNASVQTGDWDEKLKQSLPPQNESPVPHEKEAGSPTHGGNQDETLVPEADENPVPDADENQSPLPDANQNQSDSDSSSCGSKYENTSPMRTLLQKVRVVMAKSGFEFSFMKKDGNPPALSADPNASDSDSSRDLERGEDGSDSDTASEWESEGSEGESGGGDGEGAQEEGAEGEGAEEDRDGEGEGEGVSACRVCMSPARSDTLDLGCACKDDMGVIHRECALEWFHRRQNNVCEICGLVCPNLVGAGWISVGAQAQAEGPREDRWVPQPDVFHVQPLPVPPVEARQPPWWRQPRFINLVIAFAIIACVLPWIFVYFT